jgi:hypothetical protein
MLAEAEDVHHSTVKNLGFCYMFQRLFNIDYAFMDEILPELFLFKPEMDNPYVPSAYWFKRGDWTKRIPILNKCIQLTAPCK